eukprot:Skav222061  [mRNA]  locus=scaffold707:204195:204556:+ [translate_table: standard]
MTKRRKFPPWALPFRFDAAPNFPSFTVTVAFSCGVPECCQVAPSNSPPENQRFSSMCTWVKSAPRNWASLNLCQICAIETRAFDVSSI